MYTMKSPVLCAVGVGIHGNLVYNVGTIYTMYTQILPRTWYGKHHEADHRYPQRLEHAKGEDGRARRTRQHESYP